jgi:coenzyme PQQ biosynthesis protein C
MSAVLSPQELEEALRAVGARRYHNLHPFHVRLHGGRCTAVEVRAWALNRYYYQAMIPIKDATILARMEDPDLRRHWRQRIVDHDGTAAGEGGIERWLRLAEGVGNERDYVISKKGLLPITRFSVEAYVNFCRDRSLLEAIASSLTELFSPQIISERVAGMLAHYPFVNRDTLAYFTARPTQAKRDSDFALDYVRTHARCAVTQRAAIEALEFKCDVLWAQLDGLWHAYVEGEIPPGAWRPEAPA